LIVIHADDVVAHLRKAHGCDKPHIAGTHDCNLDGPPGCRRCTGKR